MYQQGRKVYSRMDYLLVMDLCQLRNFSVQDLRHNLDHSIVPGCLHGAAQREHSCYLGWRRRPPLRPLKQKTWEDQWFAMLRRAITKTLPRECHQNQSVSAETLYIVDEQVAVQHQPQRDQRGLRVLGCKVWSILKLEQKRCAETA